MFLICSNVSGYCHDAWIASSYFRGRERELLMLWSAFRLGVKAPWSARILAACLAVSAPCHAAQRTLDWANEICRYKLRFDPSKYDADRFKNTIDFVFGGVFLRFPMPSSYMPPKEGEMAAYKEVCSNYAGKLSSFAMIDLPGLQDYRNLLSLQLQNWCDFWQALMRGGQGDTAALRSFAPSAGQCSIYIDALDGKVDMNEVWRKTVIATYAKNYKPKACEAEHFAAEGKPDAAQSIRSDVLGYGWQNCSVSHSPTLDALRKKAASLERLLQQRIRARFRMVRSQCSYYTERAISIMPSMSFPACPFTSDIRSTLFGRAHRFCSSASQYVRKSTPRGHLS
jgi:hypothetical protein